MPSKHVISYLRTLLFEQDCVVIPNFGGFIINFSPATLQVDSAEILPPNKQLAFNEVLKFDDGLLSSYISRHEQISRHEALNKIKEFVHNIHNSLHTQQHYTMDGIGLFTLNIENKLVFLPEKTNFFAESYGLKAVHISSTNIKKQEDTLVIPKTIELNIVRQTRHIGFPHIAQDSKPIQKQPTIKTKKIKTILSRTPITSTIAACFLAMLCFAIYYLDYNDSNTNEGSMNPFVKTKQIANTKASTLIALPTTATMLTIKKETSSLIFHTPTYNTDNIGEKITNEVSVGKTTNHYFLVAGAFETSKSANIFSASLKKTGIQNPILIYPIQTSKGKKYIKVAIAGFQDKTVAYAQKDIMSKQLKQDIWILQQ